MPVLQADNFIAILRTACGNGPTPLHSPDWETLARMAQIHSLNALFYTGAVQYREFEACPAALRAKWQADTIAVVARQAQRTELFLQLYAALTAAGLRPLVLKGIVCRQLYGGLADYRPSCDEDLYIPPGQVARCREVLARNGWQLTSHEASLEVADHLQEIAFDDAGRQLHIELHPSLFGRERPGQRQASDYFRGIEQRAVRVEVSGVPLETLGYTDHYMYLFLHLAKHLAGGGVGIRQIIDLMQFEKAYGEQIDWQEIRRAIPALSSSGVYGDVTELGRRLGFAPRTLFEPVQPDRLLADSLEGGVYGHDREGHGRGTVLTLAAQYPTRLGRLRRLFFPSAQQLLAGRPWLEKRPWLLPAAWVQRAGRLVFNGERSRVTGKSLWVAYQRLDLLRGYGLVPGRTRARKRR